MKTRTQKMLNIFADALLIATRFGPLARDHRQRGPRDEADFRAMDEADLRRWEAQRKTGYTHRSSL
jgi:hypothetical protein